LLLQVDLFDLANWMTLLDGSSFTTRGAYAALSDQLLDEHLEVVWRSFVPQKVKIFCWLP
jgi:hypothetical protein